MAGRKLQGPDVLVTWDKNIVSFLGKNDEDMEMRWVLWIFVVWGKKGQERIFSVLAEAVLKQWTVQSVTFLDAIVAWGFGLY